MTFVKGHKNYFKHHSEETKKRLSEMRKGDNNPAKRPEVREKIRQSVKAYFSDGNNRKSLSEKMQAVMKNPEIKNKLICSHIGKLHSAECKRKMSLKRKDELHWNWKGDDVGYSGLHLWVKKRLGRPMKCEHCGKVETRSKFMHWANKTHRYMRIESDWLRLCVKCHRKYDKINQLL